MERQRRTVVDSQRNIVRESHVLRENQLLEKRQGSIVMGRQGRTVMNRQEYSIRIAILQFKTTPLAKAEEDSHGTPEERAMEIQKGIEIERQSFSLK